MFQEDEIMLFHNDQIEKFPRGEKTIGRECLQQILTQRCPEKVLNEVKITPDRLEHRKICSSAGDVTSRVSRNRTKWLFHFVPIFALFVYALYISWPYLTDVGLPAFVDAPGHAFKVWYLIDCLSDYGFAPFLWDSWWYMGYPFLQVYPPLSYMVAAFLGGTFLGGDPASGMRLTIVLSNILSAIFMYVGVYMLYRSRVGGIVAGIVYASSAYRGAAVRTGMFPFYFGTMFLPLIIPLYHRSFLSRNTRDCILTASIMALILLAHIQIFIYAALTLVLYSILIPSFRFNRRNVIGFLSEFLKNSKALVLTVLFALSLVGFWVIPFLAHRDLFYTQYPEYYLSIQSIEQPQLFFQHSKFYLGLASIGTVIVAFAVDKRARSNKFMIFFLVSTLLSGLLGVYQHCAFKGTLVEQIPYYNMVTPDRWVLITYLSLAFLVGGATKFVFNLSHQFSFLCHRPHMRSIWKILLASTIIFIVILDVGGSFARGFYGVPVIQSFPVAVEDLSGGNEYYRVFANIPGLAYIPAVTDREILAGWYIEGSVLRDWLYNLDWMTSYAERESMIAPLLELFAVKYYVIGADDHDRLVRFNRTNEFEIAYKDGFCVMELNRDVSFLSARRSILYLGKEEDIMAIGEALLFSSNSSILINGWKDYVDDYSVQELSEFDAVLLHRYDCRDQDRTDDLLLQYAGEGGVVLLAPFYTYSMLDMELYYAESEGEYEIIVNENFADTIFRDVNVTCFSPALYAEQYPWGYVALNVTSNKQETETLLTIDNNPVLATSTVGKGKIVWIGFNFLGHINHFLNKDEGRMIDNLVHWACGGVPVIELTMFEKRPYGYVDASFVVNEASSFFLLISESYYPGWRVSVDQEPAKIHMTEPKLMAVKVEANANTSVSISLRYEPTEVHILGYATTILSVSLVAIILLRPTVVRKIVTYLRARIKVRERNQVHYQRF